MLAILYILDPEDDVTKTSGIGTLRAMNDRELRDLDKHRFGRLVVTPWHGLADTWEAA